MEDAGDALIYQRIGMNEDLSLTKTTLLKLICKAFKESKPPVMITAMEECKLYYFHLWECHRSMRSLDMEPDKLQVGKITASVMAYRDIQERKDRDEDPIFQNTPPFWEDQ